MSIGTIAKGCQVICGSEPELSNSLRRGVEGMGWLRDGSIPLRFQGVAGPLIKGSRSLPAQTGWFVKGRVASL